MMALFWSSKLGCLVYRILIILISFQNDNEDLDVKRIKAEPDPIGSGELIHLYLLLMKLFFSSFNFQRKFFESMQIVLTASINFYYSLKRIR